MDAKSHFIPCNDSKPKTLSDWVKEDQKERREAKLKDDCETFYAMVKGFLLATIIWVMTALIIVYISLP